jgi:hypothetical protein
VRNEALPRDGERQEAPLSQASHARGFSSESMVSCGVAVLWFFSLGRSSALRACLHVPLCSKILRGLDYKRHHLRHMSADGREI